MLYSNGKCYLLSKPDYYIFTDKDILKEVGKIEENNDILDTKGIKYDYNILNRLKNGDLVNIYVLNGKYYVIEKTKKEI